MFNDWLDAIPPVEEFRAMKETFIKRKQHILNYWSYRWTNAYTESVNNAIKNIEKAGRGYKFDVLRDRCILSINKPTPDKFDFKKAVYVPMGKGKNKSSMYWSKREPLYKLAFHIKPVLAEDVDIPTDNMVFIPSKGNRMLDYIQSIGRVGRASKDSP